MDRLGPKWIEWNKVDWIGQMCGLNMTEVDKMGHKQLQINNGTQPNKNWKSNLYLFVLLFVLKGIQRQYDQFF